MFKKSLFLLLLTLVWPNLLRAEDNAIPFPSETPAVSVTAAVSPTPSVTPLAPPVSFITSDTSTTPVATGVSAEHLNPIDHAGIWTKFDLSYDYSDQGGLINSAGAINSRTYVNPEPVSFGSYTGSATAGHNGLGLGFEIGLLLNPSSGIAFGAHYLQNNEYNANLNYNNADQDSESLTLLPTIVPLALDYYFFLPDEGGRFFLSTGIGYYVANVRVSQNITGTYTNANFFGSDNTPGGQGGDIWSGNVSSAAVGFQVGLGREFAVNQSFGFTLFAKGRYARISNFQGKLLDSNAVAGNFGLASSAEGVVDIDSTSNITAANHEHYATMDFTGFEAGVALSFYEF